MSHIISIFKIIFYRKFGSWKGSPDETGHWKQELAEIFGHTDAYMEFSIV